MRVSRILLAGLLAARCALPTAGAAEWDDLVAGLGNLVTVAGGPGAGADNPNEWQTAHEGGPATAAELSEPHMAMDDVWGNIYVADKNAHAVRMIRPDGTISTVAGRHVFLSPNTGGFDGDGVAVEKRLCFPNGLHVLPDGTFYLVETGDAASRPGYPAGEPETASRIRRRDRDGTLTTVLTGAPLEFQRGLWVSPDESFLYFTTARHLRKWDGVQVTVLADLSAASPAPDLANLDVDRNGDILLADRFRHRVYRVPATSVGVTNPVVVAGTGALDPAPAADILDRDGQPAAALPMEEARGIGFHPLGGYVLACHKGGDIWYVDTTGRAHVLIQGRQSQNILAGENEPVTTNRSLLKIAEPRSVKVGWNGDILICTNDSGYVRVVRSLRVRPVVAPTLLYSGGAPRLTWPATTGASYFLESAVSLPGTWHTRLRRHNPGAVLQIWDDPAAAVWPRAFYRVHEFRVWP